MHEVEAKIQKAEEPGPEKFSRRLKMRFSHAEFEKTRVLVNLAFRRARIVVMRGMKTDFLTRMLFPPSGSL